MDFVPQPFVSWKVSQALRSLTTLGGQLQSILQRNCSAGITSASLYGVHDQIVISCMVLRECSLLATLLQLPDSVAEQLAAATAAVVLRCGALLLHACMAAVASDPTPASRNKTRALVTVSPQLDVLRVVAETVNHPRLQYRSGVAALAAVVAHPKDGLLHWLELAVEAIQLDVHYDDSRSRDRPMFNIERLSRLLASVSSVGAYHGFQNELGGSKTLQRTLQTLLLDTGLPAVSASILTASAPAAATPPSAAGVFAAGSSTHTAPVAAASGSSPVPEGNAEQDAQFLLSIVSAITTSALRPALQDHVSSSGGSALLQLAGQVLRQVPLQLPGKTGAGWVCPILPKTCGQLHSATMVLLTVVPSLLSKIEQPTPAQRAAQRAAALQAVQMLPLALASFNKLETDAELAAELAEGPLERAHDVNNLGWAVHNCCKLLTAPHSVAEIAALCQACEACLRHMPLIVALHARWRLNPGSHRTSAQLAAAGVGDAARELADEGMALCQLACQAAERQLQPLGAVTAATPPALAAAEDLADILLRLHATCCRLVHAAAAVTDDQGAQLYQTGADVTWPILCANLQNTFILADLASKRVSAASAAGPARCLAWRRAQAMMAAHLEAAIVARSKITSAAPAQADTGHTVMGPLFFDARFAIWASQVAPVAPEAFVSGSLMPPLAACLETLKAAERASQGVRPELQMLPQMALCLVVESAHCARLAAGLASRGLLSWLLDTADRCIEAGGPPQVHHAFPLVSCLRRAARAAAGDVAALLAGQDARVGSNGDSRGGSSQLEGLASELQRWTDYLGAPQGSRPADWVPPQVGAALEQYWALPQQEAPARLQLAQVLATRSCAYLRCGNMAAAAGGCSAGQGVGSQKCSACRTVWYCGTACSHADWREGGHKRVCKALAAARQQEQAQVQAQAQAQ